MNEISKISVNGTNYNIIDTVTSINGKTGVIGAADIEAVLSSGGYDITGNTGYTAGTGIDISDQKEISVSYGNTSGTACQGNDSRLSDSRPASDVYSWAKAETKPTYSYSEITNTPSSLPASDVSSWAKANSKPSYNLDEVTDGTSRKIPTKVSELTNDSGYLTSHQSLSGYATESWVGQQGYLTSHQSLSGYATESWVSSKFNDVLGIDASGVSDLVSILSDNDTATGILNAIASKANTSSIPTKVSDLTNDTGFITSYTNTVTSINGKTGEIAAADMATVLTAAGYALTDTNTWRPVSDSVSSTDSSTAASSKAVKTAYDLAASKTSNTGTVTKVTAGTGLTGGDITTTGTIALATSGVTAGTYKRVTVDSYGRVTSGDNTDSDTKNTAGTTNKTGTKMFLAAATEQSANPVTYSNSNCYIGTDNCLYSGGAKVLTAHDGNTLNTAGTSNKTGTKLFLAGATSQTDGVQTFSNSNCYIGTDNCLYSGGSKVLTSYTNTTYAAGTGVTISGTNNAINVTYGTAANTACQGNDSRLSNARPASDVYSWAKTASKPDYGYGEISYGVNAISSAGGTLSLAGTTPLHVVTLTGNVSALTLSANPAAGHSCHVIFTSTAERTVAIAYDSTNRVTPDADAVELTVPANGYVEIDFLTANGKVYVRGV